MIFHRQILHNKKTERGLGWVANKVSVHADAGLFFLQSWWYHAIAFMIAFDAIDLRGVRGLLLDLDNTLYEYATCHHAGMRAAWTAYQQCIAAVSFEEFAARYTHANTRVKRDKPTQAACHSRLLYFQAMIETVCGRTDGMLALLLERAYWRAYISVMRLYPEARTFLERAHAQGIRICIITNLTVAIQFVKIHHLHLDSLIDVVVTSEEAGVEKPHPHIFELALRKLRCAPHEVLMIGDDAREDIAGAVALGIRT